MKTPASRPSGGQRKEYMSEVHDVSVQIGGSEIVFETGRLAKQASGAVLVASGDTRVLSTATAGNIRDIDFMPLTVDVEERMYAAGKIPGSFFKREGRAGEKATLIARMIDRPLRPLFPKGWRYETQLVSIPLSIDHEHPYDILAMNGASAALMVSSIPFPTPVGAVRIGKVEGNFVVNPTEEQQLTADLDLVVAGTDEAILMVEAGANEITETEMLDALDIAHGEIKKLCGAQRELAERVSKPKLEITAPSVNEDLYRQIVDSHGRALDEATSVEDKLARQDATKAVEEQVLTHYSGDPAADTYAEYRGNAQLAFDKLEKDIIRQRIAVQKRRPDGRSADEIRPIATEVGLLPRAHGSALFTRGQTQALSVVALGTTREEMRLDNLGLETSKRYFHHYNFPPFSVGEAGFMRGPKRRDIGHGALAERALVPMIPAQEEFPYTIRVVSDILESNGSSSMASVCGSSLSLMDAGVPLKAPVAGVAMGLIKEGDEYIVLTDIAGVEDHLGDMDFKVAGTENGITALQMDIKITGVTFEILRDALTQAREGRLFILGKMAESITAPRTELSSFAPRISTIQIDPDKIGLLIGKGGETIRGLCDEFDAQIDVDDEGNVLVYAQTGAQGDALIDRIRSMTKEVAVGDEFPAAKVVKTTTFGAFVELAKGTDGLLHISNVSPGQRVATVEEVLNKGDEISVRVVEVDKERGRIGLRLAEDPDVAGKTTDELAAVGTGSDGGGRGNGRGDRGPRRDRDRGPRRDARDGGGGRDRERRPRGDRDPERG
jgi:polyribonucleotide nucleotidyltransferase